MPNRFNAAQAQTVDQDNRNMAAAGFSMSAELNNIYGLIDTGNIGITSAAPDVDSLCLGGEAFSYEAGTTSGLVFGYGAGRLLKGQTVVSFAANTLMLAASATNYIECDAATGVSSNTGGWTVGRTPLYIVVTGASAIATITQAKVLLQSPAPNSIPGAQLSTPGQTKHLVVPIGAASASGSILIPLPSFALAITRVAILNTVAIAQSDTNYWTFGLVDLGPSGTGTTAVIDTSADVTTKLTGGAALAPGIARNLTLNPTTGNRNTLGNDVLQFSWTLTGAPTAMAGLVLEIEGTFAN